MEMDGRHLDRIAKSLARSAARRETLKASLGGLLAAAFGTAGLEAEAKKKRCTKRRHLCEGKAKCCGDRIRCKDFPQQECQGVDLPPGKRCCGIEGASCDPHFGVSTGGNSRGNCDCCGPLWCGKQNDGKYRCQPEGT